MSDWVQILPLLALAVLFWFLVLRPARKRQADFQGLQESLAVGQRVMMTSGLFGEIVALSDETVDLRISSESVVTFARPAIARVESQGSADDAVADDTAHRDSGPEDLGEPGQDAPDGR